MWNFGVFAFWYCNQHGWLENGPFEDAFPMGKQGVSIAMLVYWSVTSWEEKYQCQCPNFSPQMLHTCRASFTAPIFSRVCACVARMSCLWAPQRSRFGHTMILHKSECKAIVQVGNHATSAEFFGFTYSEFRREVVTKSSAQSHSACEWGRFLWHINQRSKKHNNTLGFATLRCLEKVDIP